MLTKLAGYGCAMLLAAGSCGCQTWSPGAFPMQNMSRVPPPGTGTYNLDNGYYNSTPAANPGDPGTTASNAGNTSNADNGLRRVEGGLPTTDLAAAPQASNDIRPAQFTAPAAFSSAASEPQTQAPAPVASAQFTSDTESSWSATGFQAGQYETRPIDSSPSGSSGALSDQAGAANLQWQP